MRKQKSENTQQMKHENWEVVFLNYPEEGSTDSETASSLLHEIHVHWPAHVLYHYSDNRYDSDCSCSDKVALNWKQKPRYNSCQQNIATPIENIML